MFEYTETFKSHKNIQAWLADALSVPIVVA